MICSKLNLWRSLASLLLLLLSTGIWGEQVADLYTADSPVSGQGAEARAEGLREAFAKVLVKVSGDRALPGKSAMAKELAKATSYVQQYAYRALDSQPEAGVDSEGVPDRLLRVQFDEAAINQLLRSKGMPVWGRARPLVLIWLGLEIGGQRSLFQAEVEPDLRETLEQIAGSRGLPVLFPLMDLEDRASLEVSDVWGVFEQAIRQASERYQPDVILVGRLRKRSGNDWLADWTLYQPDGVKHWQTSGQTRRAVAAEGLQQTADRLATRYAPQTVTQASTSLRVRVSGLNHLADYLLVKDYLSSLDSIQSLDLLSASPAEVSFLARVEGGRDGLARGIMLGRVLEPVSVQTDTIDATSGPVDELEAESLDYRLRK